MTANTDSTVKKPDPTAHWASVADGWAKWAGWVEHNYQPLTARLAREAGWTRGVRALDVACGAGYPAIPAARLVGDGRVIGTDISPEMVAAAARVAHEAGVANAEFVVMDGDDLTYAAESFDAVTNVYGLMFSSQPARALAESLRVLRPGGRLAVVTWDEPARNPFFTVIRGAAEPYLDLAPPDSNAPGPFRFASADMLASMLRDQGFADVRVESFPMTFDLASADEYAELFADFAWKSKVMALTPDRAAQYRDAVARAVQPRLRDGRLPLLATSLVASGCKP